VLGICGGFQMLGLSIADDLGIEGEPGESPGLGWLHLHTELRAHKQLRNVHGRLTLGGEPVSGYEIHAGVSHGAGQGRPLLRLENGNDGALSEDGLVAGTYIHGVFDEPEACRALLRWAGLEAPAPVAAEVLREAALERLARSVEEELDMDVLLAWIRPGQTLRSPP
jgi:adenosylcobyric acid synthase